MYLIRAFRTHLKSGHIKFRSLSTSTGDLSVIKEISRTRKNADASRILSLAKPERYRLLGKQAED